MSCTSQNSRLFHVSNLSVRNFRIFLLMYPGSLCVGGDLVTTEPAGGEDASRHGGRRVPTAPSRAGHRNGFIMAGRPTAAPERRDRVPACNCRHRTASPSSDTDTDGDTDRSPDRASELSPAAAGDPGHLLTYPLVYGTQRLVHSCVSPEKFPVSSAPKFATLSEKHLTAIFSPLTSNFWSEFFQTKPRKSDTIQ